MRISLHWLPKKLKKLLLRTSKINPKAGNLHKKSINLFPAPATFKLRKKIFAESTKFIVVSVEKDYLLEALKALLLRLTVGTILRT